MIYDYRCPTCSAEKNNIYNAMADRNTNAPVCCGERMPIVINTAPYGYVDNMADYACPITGEGVTTRRRRNYMMESMDLVDANDFKKTSKQRKAAKAKDQAEIQAIKDEVPKDLQKQMEKEFKREIDRLSN